MRTVGGTPVTHDEAFLQAIRDEPASDVPRLVYADWLEEKGDAEAADRAEFIRVQCRLYELPEGHRGRGALEARARELLRGHWRAWVGPLRELAGPLRDRIGEGWMRETFYAEGLDRFSRGFVETLNLTARTFVEQADALAHLTPLRHLRVWRGGGCIDVLAGAPHLGWLTTLAFVDYYQYPLAADDARALAESPHLTRLRVLNLFRNGVGDEGLAALARAPWLAGLDWLQVADNGISERGVAALAASGRPLRLGTLSLYDNPIGDAGCAALAGARTLAGLRTLSLSYCGIGDAGVEALARSGLLANLHTLDLAGNLITERGARALADCPDLVGLRDLSLHNNPISADAGSALASSPYLRNLKALEIPTE
jgi:uncharacterized protein (TIGR02996 family)